MAKIDILLPVKNGIDFLAESIDSIKAQTFKDWRLVVLDHGSTDGSREMAERYHEADSRIEVHSFPEAKGLSGLLNRGLDISDCDYVMRHDADDICYPQRMQQTLDAFAAQKGIVAIGGQADVINTTGEKIGDMSMPVGHARVAAASLFRNPIAHPTAMLDFAEVKRLGVRYGDDFLKVLPAEQRIEVHHLAEDYFMFGQLAIQGKVTNIPQRLIRYRWHANNVSRTRFAEQMEMSLKISRYLAQCFAIMHGLPYVDPAPFCNHGGKLFNVDGRANFDAELDKIADGLRRGMGESSALLRELAYRRTIATRNELSLLWRYNRYRASNVPETGEWTAIRMWLLRRFPGKESIDVASEVLA